MSQLMSSLQLAAYPTIAMVIFLGVFVGVLVRLLGRGVGRVQEQAAIPLNDEQPAAASARGEAR